MCGKYHEICLMTVLTVAGDCCVKSWIVLYYPWLSGGCSSHGVVSQGDGSIYYKLRHFEYGDIYTYTVYPRTCALIYIRACLGTFSVYVCVHA